jgi:hypothetical protein
LIWQAVFITFLLENQIKMPLKAAKKEGGILRLRRKKKEAKNFVAKPQKGKENFNIYEVRITK